MKYKSTVEFDGEFIIKRRTLINEPMFNFLYELDNNNVKHIDRYQVYYYDITNKSRTWDSLKKFMVEWRRQLIPYQIDYVKTIHLPKWKRYKDNRFRKCNSSCEFYSESELKDGNMIRICNKIDVVLKNINGPRYKKCPFVYSNIEHKLGGFLF